MIKEDYIIQIITLSVFLFVAECWYKCFGLYVFNYLLLKVGMILLSFMHSQRIKNMYNSNFIQKANSRTVTYSLNSWHNLFKSVLGLVFQPFISTIQNGKDVSVGSAKSWTEISYNLLTKPAHHIERERVQQISYIHYIQTMSVSLSTDTNI